MIKKSILLLISLICFASNTVLAMDHASRALQSALNKRLLVAAQTGTPLAIAALINAGARVTCLHNISGQQELLRVAITHNNTQTALYLIEQVEDINASDNAGDTLLHVTTEIKGLQDTRILEALVKRGARLDDCNKKKQPPLAIAFNSRNAVAIKWLIEAGANTDILVDDNQACFSSYWWFYPANNTAGELCAPRIPLYDALKLIKPSIIEAVVTAIAPQEMRHIVPSCILFTIRKIAGNHISNMIMAQIMQDVICTKLATAKKYLKDVSEAELRAAIIENIKIVITKSPYIPKSPDPE